MTMKESHTSEFSDQIQKNWHSTVTFSQILQQKFYSRNQLKNWHFTVIISQILQQSSMTKINSRAGILLSLLIKFCSKNSMTAIIKNADIILSQFWSKFIIKIKFKHWHHIATNQLFSLSDQILSERSNQCQADYQFNSQFNDQIQQLIQLFNLNWSKSISTSN